MSKYSAEPLANDIGGIRGDARIKTISTSCASSRSAIFESVPAFARAYDDLRRALPERAVMSTSKSRDPQTARL
jgi:hypothetical protein